MGQEQPGMSDKNGKLQEKEVPQEKDRASAKFERRIDNNPAMNWKDSKPEPASRPT